MSSQFNANDNDQDTYVYSEINPNRESSPPHVETFQNQAYSINKLVNTDKVFGTKTTPCKEKSKNNQCERNLVCIVISVIILLLLAVGAVAVAALVQVSKKNLEMVSNNSSLLRAELSKLNDEIVSLRASLSNSSAVLSRKFSALETKTQIQFDGLNSRVDYLYTLHSNETNTNINPAASCSLILQLNSSSPSGHYWIRSSNGSVVRVYCDMTRSCGGVTGGWTRVASLDRRDNSSQCPSGLRTGSDCNPEPTCVLDIDPRTGNCSSNSYTSHGLNYSHVCGMIRGYQVRNLDAFRNRNPIDINSNYVDGVSLTHGVPPLRQHIWTFAAVGTSGKS